MIFFSCFVLFVSWNWHAAEYIHFLLWYQNITKSAPRHEHYFDKRSFNWMVKYSILSMEYKHSTLYDYFMHICEKWLKIAMWLLCYGCLIHNMKTIIIIIFRVRQSDKWLFHRAPVLLFWFFLLSCFIVVVWFYFYTNTNSKFRNFAHTEQSGKITFAHMMNYGEWHMFSAFIML